MSSSSRHCSSMHRPCAIDTHTCCERFRRRPFPPLPPALLPFDSNAAAVLFPISTAPSPSAGAVGASAPPLLSPPSSSSSSSTPSSGMKEPTVNMESVSRASMRQCAQGPWLYRVFSAIPRPPLNTVSQPRVVPMTSSARPSPSTSASATSPPCEGGVGVKYSCTASFREWYATGSSKDMLQTIGSTVARSYFAFSRHHRPPRASL